MTVKKPIRSPKEITVFGKPVKLRGNLDRRVMSDGPYVGEARGLLGVIKVHVERRRGGAYEVQLTSLGVWSKWKINKSLTRAIANAEAAYREAIAKSERSVGLARQIVGRS